MKRGLFAAVGVVAVLAVAMAWADEQKADSKCPACCAKKSGSAQSCGCSKCCGATSTVALDEKDPLAAAKCPISGQKISKDACVAYKGGKVYFCCNNCAAKFEKDKAKYEVKANRQLVLTGQAKQKACPFSGQKTDDSTKITVAGIDVTFCCGNCKAKVEKASAEKQCEMVFGGKNFDKAFEVKKD
ncbi:MAG: hypothetical protein ACLQNE_27605 [Thermoguttaceae bacterium]